jgi:hypothetical protein
VIEIDGAVRGWLGYEEEDNPDYRHVASYERGQDGTWHDGLLMDLCLVAR